MLHFGWTSDTLRIPQIVEDFKRDNFREKPDEPQKWVQF